MTDVKQDGWAPKWLVRWLVGPKKLVLLEAGHNVSAPLFRINVGFGEISAHTTLRPSDMKK